MTLNADLIAISSVAVGGGTAYPVVRSRITTRYEGTEQQNDPAYRVETWELTCHAFAAAAGDVGTLSETIRTDLCQRGAAVVLTEWAGSRTLPAGGAADGSLPGFPTVELADEPERCFGNVLTFTLRCEARIPQHDLAGLVEHGYERTEETDEDGDVRITQRGTYRVANGSDAKAAAQTAVIDPAQADATANDRNFTVRWTLGADAALARYEYQAWDKNFVAANVTEAQLTDRTTRTAEGRITRTISGYAIGSGAQAWIDAQAPTPDATNILVRKETSPASVPDGRLNFLWEVLTGVTDAQFPNITIFGFRESIEEAENVDALTAATYLNRDPVLRYIERQPSLYTQRTRIDFLGSWAEGVAAVTQLFDDANLVTAPRRTLSAGPYGLKTLDYTAVYMYETPVVLKPDPREIPAVS